MAKIEFLKYKEIRNTMLEKYGQGWSGVIDAQSNTVSPVLEHIKFVLDNNLINKSLEEIIILWKLTRDN